jgi:hypothetical protein
VRRAACAVALVLAMIVPVCAQLSAGELRLVLVRGEIANLTNRLRMINFAGLFSGTVVAPPRSVNQRVRLEV